MKSTKIGQKKGQTKNDNFSHFAKHRLIKKNVLLQPPFSPKKNVFFKLFVLKPKTLMLNKKHNLKSEKKKIRKRDLKGKARQDTIKKRKY